MVGLLMAMRAAHGTTLMGEGSRQTAVGCLPRLAVVVKYRMLWCPVLAGLAGRHQRSSDFRKGLSPWEQDAAVWLAAAPAQPGSRRRRTAGWVRSRRQTAAAAAAPAGW